jgi:hypothetical protein
MTPISRWKLLLSPKDLIKDMQMLSHPKLPKGKSIVDVFADFMGYLYRCAKTYIIDALPSGGVLWDSVGSNIKFILTHPNGWEGAQQSMMRRAAVLAGLVPDTQDGHSRIAFVTEGEASFNYCATNGLSVDAFRASAHFFRLDEIVNTLIGGQKNTRNRRRRWYYRPQRIFNRIDHPAIR